MVFCVQQIVHSVQCTVAWRIGEQNEQGLGRKLINLIPKVLTALLTVRGSGRKMTVPLQCIFSLVLLHVVERSSAAKILGGNADALTGSHYMMTKNLMEELASRGHEVMPCVFLKSVRVIMECLSHFVFFFFSKFNCKQRLSSCWAFHRHV